MLGSLDSVGHTVTLLQSFSILVPGSDGDVGFEDVPGGEKMGGGRLATKAGEWILLFSGVNKS
jgi:hypothetical protein